MLGALCVMHRALGHRPPASKKDLWTTTTSLHPFVYGRACSCLIIPDDLKLSTLTCMVMVWPSPTQLAAITISHFALSYTAWIQATIKRRCPCSSKYAAHLSMPDSNNQVIREAATVVDAEYIATFAHESHIEWRVGQTQQVWIALFLSYAFLDMLTSIRTRLFTCGRLSIKHLMRPVAADIPLAPHPTRAHMACQACYHIQPASLSTSAFPSVFKRCYVTHTLPNLGCRFHCTLEMETGGVL
jgi:hypothetical protein